MNYNGIILHMSLQNYFIPLYTMAYVYDMWGTY